MTPLDALKSGIKTAVITFAAGLLAVVVGLLGAVTEWAQDGPAPDLGNLRGAVWALLAALFVGVINSAIRYVQVIGIPFVAALFDRVFGKPPAYPEPSTNKVIDATARSVETTVREQTGAVVKQLGRPVVIDPD